MRPFPLRYIPSNRSRDSRGIGWRWRLVGNDSSRPRWLVPVGVLVLTEGHSPVHPMKKSKALLKKAKKPASKTTKKLAQKRPAKKKAVVAKAKVPIEEADLENMTDAAIRRTYSEEIKEHARWLWREQGHGGTYTMRDCINETMREIRVGDWPYRDDE